MILSVPVTRTAMFCSLKSYNLEVTDNIVDRMIILLEDVLSGISVSDKTKLFINVVEEQAVFPMALLNYVNL